jgi:hypothetical protein
VRLVLAPLAALLAGRKTPGAAVADLMQRPLKIEAEAE